MNENTENQMTSNTLVKKFNNRKCNIYINVRLNKERGKDNVIRLQNNWKDRITMEGTCIVFLCCKAY